MEGEEKGEGGKGGKGKNEPACSKKEQAGGVCWLAGVAKGDRKIRRDQTATLIREIAHAWSMLFELNARQGVGFVCAEDEDLAVAENLGSLTPTLP